MTNDQIIAIIPARYHSKRFPGKMLATVKGIPLILASYKNALKSKILSDVIVATDHQLIYDCIRENGGKAIMTSVDCQSGSDRIAEALIQNPALQHSKIIVNIQGDEPGLMPETIDQVALVLTNDQEASVATAITPLTNESEAFNSSTVKCVIDSQSHALYFSRAFIPYGKEGVFNSKTRYYKHLGIYAYRPDFLLRYAKMECTPLQQAEDLEQLKILENGYKIRCVLAEQDSIGIDTPEDLTRYLSE